MQWKGNCKAGLREGHCLQVERAHKCAKREYFSSSFIFKQSRINRVRYSGEGRASPTFMGLTPITSGDSYDVIRGGHRQFWLVRR